MDALRPSDAGGSRTLHDEGPDDLEGARRLISRALARGESALSESEAKAVFAAYGIPVTPGAPAADVEDALAVAAQVGYPVVMKGSSRTILHKSEAGLVLMDIRDGQGLRAGWELLQQRGFGELDGVLVERMIPPGREFVVGMTRDPQFGPVVMFGVGGVLTEALNDVAFGIAPLDEREARQLQYGIRATRLLGAFRGAPPVDREALDRLIQAVGRIAMENPEVDEIDINPVLVDQGRPVAVDALVHLKQPVSGDSKRLPASPANLWALFSPGSLAIVGASNDPTKWGGLIMASLLSGGYSGEVYPVNPKAAEIFDRPAYPTVSDLPVAPDLVLAAVPAPHVAQVVEDCGRKGVKAVVVITAGFEEVGPEGAEQARKAATIASRYGMVMIGPNSLGTMCSWNRLYGTGAAVLQPDPGPASFLSQSGSMGMQLMSAAERHKAGVGKYVGLGNEALFETGDLIDYFRDDPQTGVILTYVESIRDGRRFLESLRRATRTKPVVVLRGGTSEFGKRAAASHTGAMASSAPVFEAAMRQSGATYITNSAEFLDLTYAFSYLPLPRGRRVAIVSFGGGWGVLSADEVARQGLELATLEPAVMDKLNALLPSFWSHSNPIDLAGTFTDKGEPEGAVHAAAPSEMVDAVIVLGVLGIVSQPQNTVQAITRLKIDQGIDISRLRIPDMAEYMKREVVFIQRVAEMMEEYGKPIINVPFAPTPQYIYKSKGRYSVVVLPSPTRAVSCIAHMARYREYLQSVGAFAK